MQTFKPNCDGDKSVLIKLENQPGVFVYTTLKADPKLIKRAERRAEEVSRRASRVIEERSEAAEIASS